MEALALAAAAFAALHVGLAATGLRAGAVRAIGEGPYRGVFSLLSAAFLAALIWTFGQARLSPDNLPLWSAPSWTLHAAHLINTLAVTLAAAGLLSPGPTLAGFEGALKNPEPARGALRITRHPFLWGVALWGAGHLLVNPEAATVLLFGPLTAMVLLGTRSIDRKGAARDPEAWARFAAVTSNVPFAAIVQGRNRFALGELWWRLLAGVAAAGAIFHFHGALFGVAAIR